jgi:hypothetical protein
LNSLLSSSPKRNIPIGIDEGMLASFRKVKGKKSILISKERLFHSFLLPKIEGRYCTKDLKNSRIKKRMDFRLVVMAYHSFVES